MLSALNDSRFDPITESELSYLQCSVSILHSFEESTDWRDWIIGQHGVRVTYQNYSATFLPEVMKAQDWDHRETIEAALKKGGFRFPVDESILAGCRVLRYQSSKSVADYSEYRDWKETQRLQCS